MPEKFTLEEYDKKVKNLSKYPEIIGEKIENFKFKDALKEIMNLARLGNKYLSDTEPWKLKKINEKRTKTIMNVSLQIAVLTINSF